MAIHHGKEESEYLVNQEINAQSSQITLALFAGAAIGALAVYIPFEFPMLNTWIRVSFLSILSLLVIIVFILFAIPLIKRQNNFRKGLTGEDRAGLSLHALPHSYHVFQDIKIAEKSNIDFVVVGPTGVFNIEVKNMDGAITEKNGKIHVNGRELKHVGQAYYEHKDLEKKIGSVVSPILAYTGKVDIHFGMQKVAGVQVVGLDWLRKIILEGKQVLSSDEIDEKVALLTPYLAIKSKKPRGRQNLGIV